MNDSERQELHPADIDKEKKLAAIREHGAYVSAPVGTSMRPMLRAGRDTVVIVAPSGRLRKYDVALFCYKGNHVMHRVVKVTQGGYVFRGDNCIATEHGTDNDVIGVMSEFYRGERKVSARAPFYRLYARFIVDLFPLRRFVRRVKAALASMLARMLGKYKQS